MEKQNMLEYYYIEENKKQKMNDINYIDERINDPPSILQ